MPVIPKGDNLGNALPKAGRTNLQGGDSPMGRAMVGLGREVTRVGLQMQHEREQKQQQINQVNMSNALLEHEKQVNTFTADMQKKIDSGEIAPDKVNEYWAKGMKDISKPEIGGLTEYQQEQFNYHLNRADYDKELRVSQLQDRAVSVSAETAINEHVRNIKENPNADLAQSLSSLDTEAIDSTGRARWGQQWTEVKAGLKRDLTFTNLSSKATSASSNNDYKFLNQFKKDVINPEKYTDLQIDDRAKLESFAKQNMSRMEREWKAAANQLKADISYSDQNVLTASANGDLLDNPYAEKDYINAFGQKDGSRRYKNVTEWQTEVAPKILSYKDMNVADIVKDVDASKPIDKDHDMYASQDRVHKFKAAAAQQVINEKINNPFNAAVKSGLFKPFDSANPDDMTTEIARRYAAQPELRKIDINAPLLSKSEADMLSQSIRGSKNTDAQIALLKGLGEKLPPEAVKGVAAQIAPDSGSMAFSVMLLNTPQSYNSVVRYKEIPVNEAVKKAFDPKLRDLPRPMEEVITSTVDINEAVKTILQGDQLLNPTEAIKKSGVSKVSLPSDNKLKESFDSYVGNAFQHNPQAYQLTFDVYKSAYAGLAYRSGRIDDRDTSEVSSSVSEKAALMATGGVAKNVASNWFSNKQAVVMPYGMDESTFKDKYKAATIQSLKEAGLNYNGWDDLTPVSVGNNTYRLTYGGTGRWAVNPETGDFVIVEFK